MLPDGSYILSDITNNTISSEELDALIADRLADVLSDGIDIDVWLRSILRNALESLLNEHSVDEIRSMIG